MSTGALRCSKQSRSSSALELLIRRQVSENAVWHRLTVVRHRVHERLFAASRRTLGVDHDASFEFQILHVGLLREFLNIELVQQAPR